MRLATPSLLRLSDIIEYLIDPRVGIIRQVEESPAEAGAPNFFHFYAIACNTGAFARQQNFANTGGASANRQSALAKAVGEAVERYCAALYEVTELPLTSRENAPFPCVAPDAFARYAPSQYKAPGMIFVPFEDATPVRWVPAIDQLTGEERYVPAAMVYVPYYYYLQTGEVPIVQPISTGLACHCTPAEAALNGLCEVVERDAFMITWQARMSRPQIAVESLSDANYDLVRRFERTGASVTLLDVTLDAGIPTVLSVLRSPSPNSPAFVFASAAALSPEDAVRKCLDELAHTRRYMQQITTTMPRLPVMPPGHENVIDQQTHLNFWCDHSNGPLADFIFASRRRVDFNDIEDRSTGDPARDLDVACRRLRDAGSQVLVADLTTPDVAELGLSVVRAIIPGYHPLMMGFATRALGGRRLWEVPQKLGYQGVSLESGDNPAPHPFP
jgi:ribosomal protein S12 methylthiotransferase accessory factor